MTAKRKYERRRLKYQISLDKQTKTANIISNLRLAAFITGLGGAGLLYFVKYYYLCAAVLLVFAVIFSWLAARHGRILNNKKYSSVLFKINDDSIKRLDGGWKTFADAGCDFSDDNHRYSADLDIFGKGSLFQWINTANTHTGRLRLRTALAEGPADTGQILKRQEAVTELAGKLKWRQRFSAEGLVVSGKVTDPEYLYKWAENRLELFRKPWVIVLLRILPVVTLAVILLYLAAGAIPYYYALLVLAVNYGLLRLKGKEAASAFITAEKYNEDMKTYDRMLKLSEGEDFSSGYIRELKSRMLDGKGRTASRQVAGLSAIMNSVSDRRNAFYFVFNLLTLWDYQCLAALEDWKAGSGSFLKVWFDSIGEMEALASLAVIRFDHPDWASPEIAEGTNVYTAQAIGHPLLGEERIYNDFNIKAPPGILLITGSNMSGKSTLLRTAGINLVLAYAGAPVCAANLKCSIMDVYTCMRVGDNLEKSISTFYAEILRIKMIVEAVETGRPVFFLLDETFKGTNSIDRHTGAKILINKLSKAGPYGLVSTHDLELGSLEEESGGSIRNFHFREYYEDSEIHFDYKLRSGVSTTRNAMYLMKLAGIDIRGD